MKRSIYETTEGSNEIKNYFKTDASTVTDDTLTFTIVRNPYHRLISVFNHGIGYGRFYDKESWESLPYKKFDFSENTDFESFVKAIITIPHDQIDDFTGPQSHRIFSDKNKRIQFIAKLENISEDWGCLMKVYGSSIPFPFSNQTSGWLEERKDKITWTEQLKKLVFDYYRDDFELFDYDIDSIDSEPNKATFIGNVKPATIRFNKSKYSKILKQIESNNNNILSEEFFRKITKNKSINNISETGNTKFFSSKHHWSGKKPTEHSSTVKEYSIPVPEDSGYKLIYI